ncbi:glycosyltransferase family 4 protein [bacterium]|nr:glycosyltransferase family 4 protein [bacterium]
MQNTRLIIVGPDCGELANIKKLIRTLDLESKVIFAGSVAPQKIKKFLGICDIFVLPSLYEGLPLALLEAMAAGKAVIFSNLLCAKKIIADGENGLLAKPADVNSLADAIIKLARDKKLREYLGVNAGKRAKKINSYSEAWAVRAEYAKVLKDYGAKA